MQSELGGLFYEMAIRDHIRLEVLVPKAAELQRIDAELGQLELLMETGASRWVATAASAAPSTRAAPATARNAVKLWGWRDRGVRPMMARLRAIRLTLTQLVSSPAARRPPLA